MTKEIQCARCAETAASLEVAPWPGETGELVLASTCARCWQEWQRMEIMVINELRLDFMNPQSQTILETQMREFLQLGDGDTDGA